MIKLTFADLQDETNSNVPPSKLKKVIEDNYVGGSRDLRTFPVIRSNKVADRILAVLEQHTARYYIKNRTPVRLKATAGHLRMYHTATSYEAY